MGAKVIADLVRNQEISPEEGEYLLGFCNNVSPAFFLNYICLVKLKFPSVPWKLALLFYGLPVFYGILTRPLYHFSKNPSRSTAFPSKKQAPWRRLDFPMLDACIMDGFSTITRLGGYIMLFAILVQFLSLLPLSGAALAFLSALLEISCGVDQIALLTGLSPVLRTAFICMAGTFGGLCICTQTQSVLDGTPLSVVTWLKGRIILAFLVFLLTALFPTVAAVG